MPTSTTTVISTTQVLVKQITILMVTDESGPSAHTMTMPTDVSFSRDPLSASKLAGRGIITLAMAGMGCPSIIRGRFPQTSKLAVVRIR